MPEKRGIAVAAAGGASLSIAALRALPSISHLAMVVLLWLFLLGSWPLPTQAAGAQYVYDAGGRLIQVIAPNGTSAKYTYDPAGNLLAVTPLSASTAAVTGFSTVSASSGNTVTIYGSGFSPTAANDHVSFGGIAATVLSATSNSITVTVPNGATTGSALVVESKCHGHHVQCDRRIR